MAFLGWPTAGGASTPSLFLGSYATLGALTAAAPTPVAGNYALVAGGFQYWDTVAVNWVSPGGVQIDIPIAQAGMAIAAGMVVRVDESDSKCYPAVGSNLQGGPSASDLAAGGGPSRGGWPVLRIAKTSVLIGGACLIATESVTQANWSAATMSGAATLLPGRKYHLSKSVAGKITENYALAQATVSGDVEVTVGIATSATCLVFDPALTNWVP